MKRVTFLVCSLLLLAACTTTGPSNASKSVAQSQVDIFKKRQECYALKDAFEKEITELDFRASEEYEGFRVTVIKEIFYSPSLETCLADYTVMSHSGLGDGRYLEDVLSRRTVETLEFSEAKEGTIAKIKQIEENTARREEFELIIDSYR
ncbi:MAG: hypothetical protein PHU71_01145 [Candidatus Gracilibacteria bacterium]|nr:hypothetical protein [Candidatus Gracilibacteria bacterium]